ncbi:MAG: N-acetylglucosamine-6-phosphate deacetylase [Ancrocorticia sp.]|uniref:N-acetylglucosamine-6-phosphate deacetylase n=1 Tax=Ancrocorticia sp. TaxID=2593684 RepID=UPI003F8DC01C
MSESGAPASGRRFDGLVLDGYGNVAGHGLVLDGEGRIREIIRADGPAPAGYIIPGLVDLHCHGGGGTSFPDDLEPEAIARGIEAHRNAGTTALVASLVSMVDPLPAIRALVPFCQSGELAGIHMEGPFVSPHKAGAQNPEAIRDGNLAELETWLRAGDGWIRTMTVAPEIPHAAEVAAMLLAHGAKPSWGHTSATADQAAQAMAGVVQEASHSATIRQTATHLFNAMPPLSHRAPGPVREFIQGAKRGEISVELIADGVHLAPELVEDLVDYLDLAGTAVFVTDAMAAAGMPEGAYQLGGLDVEVKDGAARLAGSSTIAGGCSKLSDQVALMGQRGALSLPQIVRATVSGPVRAASLLREGRAAKGVTLTYEIGVKPNAVVLDADFRVVQVIREGVVL